MLDYRYSQKLVLQCCLLTLSTFLFSGNASAGWQWADWGMSVNDAFNASSGEARKITSVERENQSWAQGGKRIMRADLHTSHRVDNMNFDVWFLFSIKDNLLKCVNLVPNGEVHPGRLRSRLVEAYGSPDDTGSGPFLRTTTWLTDIDNIVFRDGGKGLRSVLYCERSEGF